MALDKETASIYYSFKEKCEKAGFTFEQIQVLWEIVSMMRWSIY